MFVNPELHTLSSIQQIQTTQPNVKDLTLTAQNSTKKCRLPLLTTSQSLLNFNQQQNLLAQQQQNNLIKENSTLSEASAWSNEYIFQSSIDCIKNVDKGK